MHKVKTGVQCMYMYSARISVKVGKINLLQKHKDIISNTRWLDDSIINAAQCMLRMVFLAYKI